MHINLQHSTLAGLLWSKQFYHYIVEAWLDGDPEQPKPPPGRKEGRNKDWKHLFNRDVVSMPDKWEYPWVSIFLTITFYITLTTCSVLYPLL